MTGRRRSPLAQAVKDQSELVEEDSMPVGYIPTGSTLLNLALTGSIYGGWPVGKMTNLIGDSSAGKTVLALTTLAESVNHAGWKGYLPIFDDAENALAKHGMEKLFGKATFNKIKEPPRGNSKTTEMFQNNVLDMIAKGDPFIYVLDSFDSISTDDELEQAEIKRQGKDGKGTYGTEKAKAASSIFRIIIRELDKTQSPLIVISQTRDNLSSAMFKPKTRSGGRALKFYATHEIWMAVKERIKQKDKQVGVLVSVKITKNKVNGWEGVVQIPIYRTYGVDDIGSCLDYLEENADATKTTGLARKKLVSRIEEEPDEYKRIQHEVAEVWAREEAKLDLKRKPKYL